MHPTRECGCKITKNIIHNQIYLEEFEKITTLLIKIIAKSFVIRMKKCIFAENLLTNMVTTELTMQQIQRAIGKIAAKYNDNDDQIAFTDIHLRATQEEGELLAFDDEGVEVNRCVIDEWIAATDEDFYDQVAKQLRNELQKANPTIEQMAIAKPFSFILENEDGENVCELFVSDDDMVIIGGDLMDDLDSDLDAFFNDLMKE